MPEVTDIIVALGSDAQLAAISDNCVKVRDAQRVGTAFLPDTDAIKQLGAELVFVSAVTGSAYIEVLKNAGIAVAVVESAASYADLPALYSGIATLISGGITGARNAANTFKGIDEKIKAHANSNSFSVSGAILVADGVSISADCIAAELAAFAGITLCDAVSAEVIVCSESIYETVRSRYADKRVVSFDVTQLERRGANMYDAVAALTASLKSE